MVSEKRYSGNDTFPATSGISHPIRVLVDRFLYIEPVDYCAFPTYQTSSLNVTRLISRNVVPPSITFLKADCRSVIMPPVTAR